MRVGNQFGGYTSSRNPPGEYPSVHDGLPRSLRQPKAFPKNSVAASEKSRRLWGGGSAGTWKTICSAGFPSEFPCKIAGDSPWPALAKINIDNLVIKVMLRNG